MILSSTLTHSYTAVWSLCVIESQYYSPVRKQSDIRHYVNKLHTPYLCWSTITLRCLLIYVELNEIKACNYVLYIFLISV